jgi:ABC-2 type transport system permease protein
MDDKKINKEETTDKTPKKDWKAVIVGKSSKRGIYMASTSAIAIALVIVFNLILGSIPSGTLEFDMTSNDAYKVTAQSVDFLAELDQNIEIVVLAQSVGIDERLQKFINNYAKLSPKITLKEIDPVLYPTALETYEAEDNTVVVRNTDTGKSKVVNLAGFYGYMDGLILYDYQTYSQTGQLVPVYMDAEGQLTSAINYVNRASEDTVYLLSGHGEAELGNNALNRLGKANIVSAPLNLLKDSIPEDCELILCNNPTSDLADDELDTLLYHLKNGGNVMVLLDSPDFKNFNTLLTTYGLQMQPGIIGDTEPGRYYQQETFSYFCILPVQSTSDPITSSLINDALVLYARGMTEITPERRGSTVSPFMTTSGKGQNVVDENTVTEGTYILGATAVETFEDAEDTASRLTVISAVSLIDDGVTSAFPNLSNLDIFLNAIAANLENSSYISIPQKNLQVTYYQPANMLLWGIFFIGIVPLGFIGAGIVYWTKRRKR